MELFKWICVCLVTGVVVGLVLLVFVGVTCALIFQQEEEEA